jgi:hypothetical protein
MSGRYSSSYCRLSHPTITPHTGHTPTVSNSLPWRALHYSAVLLHCMLSSLFLRFLVAQFLTFCVLLVYSYLVFGASCSIVNLLEQSARPGTILASTDAARALPEYRWTRSRTNENTLKATAIQSLGLLDSVEVAVNSISDENTRFCQNGMTQGAELFQDDCLPAKTASQELIQNSSDGDDLKDVLISQQVVTRPLLDTLAYVLKSSTLQTPLHHISTKIPTLV